MPGEAVVGQIWTDWQTDRPTDTSSDADQSYVRYCPNNWFNSSNSEALWCTNRILYAGRTLALSQCIHRSLSVWRVQLVIHLLPYVHSSVNPLIYSFMSHNFRRTVRALWSHSQARCRRCCCRGGSADPAAAGPSTTGASSSWRWTRGRCGLGRWLSATPDDAHCPVRQLALTVRRPSSRCCCWMTWYTDRAAAVNISAEI